MAILFKTVVFFFQSILMLILFTLFIWSAITFLPKLKRKPDFIVGDDQLQRWYILPHNHYFNLYLHKILKSDCDGAMHDHPWWSLSIPLRGYMWEKTPRGVEEISKWIPKLRSPTYKHSLIVLDPVWTLFITGPNVRKWGFWVKGKFVYYREYLNLS